MKTITEVNEQPAAKLQTMGVNTVSDAENLSIILGGAGSLELAKNLLKSVSYNLRDLAKLTFNELHIAGLTERQTACLIASFELSRRKALQETSDRTQIKCSKDIFDVFAPLVSDLQYEEFHVVYLNRANKIIKFEKISQGGISGTVTDVRIIMKNAITCLASGMIVCHNHPSGNLNPSDSDTKITLKIKEAGNLLDVQLLDHIIISDKDYYSFADNGLI